MLKRAKVGAPKKYLHLVAEIEQKLAEGYTQKSIQEHYGITHKVIFEIKRGEYK